MTPEQRVAWALHAFPRRFRAARSDEIWSTIADAEEHGDQPYGWRSIVDIVRAGWGERHRTRPPLWTYLAYRFGRRLQPRWHAWMLDDVHGWIGLRQMLVMYLFIVPVSAGLAVGASSNGPSWGLVAVWTATLLISPLTNGRNRREILRRHGYDPRTEGWPAPRIPWAIQPRNVVPARRLLLGIGLGLAVAGPTAAVSLLAAPLMPQTITVGSFTTSRDADAGLLTAVGALCLVLAAGVAVGSFVLRQRLLSRLSPPDDLTEIRPCRLTDWLPGAAIAVVGVVCSTLPMAPLAVPIILAIATGASPAMVALGIRAGTIELASGTPVWFRVAHRVAHPTT